ncbi:unnamed protein product, partial [Symbiodinium sp. KB8]
MSPWLATALAAVLLLRLNGLQLPTELGGFGSFSVEELEDALWVVCQPPGAAEMLVCAAVLGESRRGVEDFKFVEPPVILQDEETFNDLNPESSSGGSSDSSDEDTGREREPDDDDDDDNSRKSRDDGGADKGYPDGPSSSGAITTTRTIIAPEMDFTDREFEHLLKMIEGYSLDKTSGITDQDVTNFINNAQ